MLFAVSMLAGAVVLWLVIDWFLWRHNERRQGIDGGWEPFGSEPIFQATGWEETLPPTEVDLFDPADDRRALPI